MILTALERYASYMYYAYYSDTLRSKDSKNLIDFIDTALECLIFIDPEPQDIDYEIASILNEAQIYAGRLDYWLDRPNTHYKIKTVFDLIGKIHGLSFYPNLPTLED